MKAVFLGFIGSLIIMVMTLMWSYYSSTKELTVSKISHDVVISPSATIDGINIFYHENKIINLSKSVFSIENTGRIAIKQSDIVSPLIIGLHGNVKIFDFILNDREPSNIDVDLLRDKDKNSAVITSSLLNPGDKFKISVLSDSTESPDIYAMARIDGVKDIRVNNEVNKNGLLYSTFLWFCFVFSMCSLLLSFVFFNDLIKEIKVKKFIKNKNLDIPDDANSLPLWVKDKFSFYQEKEIKILTNAISELSNKAYEQKLNKIEDVSKGFVSNFGPGAMCLILGGSGIWFSLNALGFI
ncbi:hypothetical protein [Erwinia rhapontici]|uniref:hypothetical protein n=1 Tax=Erwinia rhapontici TaxID=55212 RepID=UPI00105CF805|nr:hypothetical protein [Erwinia rhapontici]TDS99810.1 hypothetical protein EDF84_103111 [Erwinia rhapontici]